MIFSNVYELEELSNELWPSLKNNVIKSKICTQKLGSPGHGIQVQLWNVIKTYFIKTR